MSPKRPFWKLTNAIRLPSGDHDGASLPMKREGTCGSVGAAPAVVATTAAIAATLSGGVAGFQAAGPAAAFRGSVILATRILSTSRRFVQKRPITGPASR